VQSLGVKTVCFALDAQCNLSIIVQINLFCVTKNNKKNFLAQRSQTFKIVRNGFQAEIAAPSQRHACTDIFAF